MRIPGPLQPTLSRLFTSPRAGSLRRRLHRGLAAVRGSVPPVEVYLNPSDPQSGLVAQAVDRMFDGTSVPVRRYAIALPGPPLQAAPARWLAWAERDARDRAAAWGLVVPVSSEVASDPDAARRLHRAGDYRPGTVVWAGETFYGIDRMDLLADRLGAAGVGVAWRPRFDTTQLTPWTGSELEVWVSVRSPYSYVAVARLDGVAGVRLRPVLPMVTRGLPVPRLKRFALLRDAAREAHRHAIPFDRVRDPLGGGVERVLAVWASLDAQASRRFLLCAMRGIWSSGVDVATDAGLRGVAEAAGVTWSQCVDALREDTWRSTVEANRAALGDEGLWGVPSFRIGANSCWGQDRLEGVLARWKRDK